MLRQAHTMVFKSPPSKFPQDSYDGNESMLSGSRPTYAPGRESVNSRKTIMMHHSNTIAYQGALRSQLVSKQPNGKQFNPLEFNPKKYVTKDLKEQDIVQLKQVFDFYDSEGAGMLSPNDLNQLLATNGFNPTKDTLYEIFSELDEEELGGITFEYFIKMLQQDKIKSEKKDTVRRVYRKYDKQNKGFITMDDLRTVVYKDLGEEIDEDVLAEIFRRTDSNQDGKMTFEDFYNVMSKKVYY